MVSTVSLELAVLALLGLASVCFLVVVVYRRGAQQSDAERALLLSLAGFLTVLVVASDQLVALRGDPPTRIELLAVVGTLVMLTATLLAVGQSARRLRAD